MKRGVFDVLRRGFDNTAANWQLILLRLGETLLFVLLAVATVLAIVIPILVTVGIELSRVDTPEDLLTAAMSLMEKWILLVWIVVAIFALSIVLVAIHSFVEAGCARVNVDAERIAGAQLEGPRSRYRIFSMDRFFAGAKDGWWTLFWIYNLAWGFSGLILLVPLVFTLLLMLVFREQQAALLTTGCAGLVLTLMVMFVVGFVTTMWTKRATAGWAVRRAGARDALASGWRAVRHDLGRHLLVALAVFVVGLAGSSFFTSFSFLAAFGEAFGRGNHFVPFFTLPLRMAVSFLGWAFGSIVTSWYLASYSAIAVETND